MNQEETELIANALLDLSDIADQTDALHQYLTDFLIQKGETNVKDPDNFNLRRN